MNPLWVLIMFVILPNGSQTAVRVGFQDQMACVAAGKALQQGFTSSAYTRDMKVVWSCNMDRTIGAIEPVPQPPPVVEQPPPRRQARPRARQTPPAEPAPATEESVRKSLPSWLGGEKK